MSEIRVALAGVGNCASALIQGVQYYSQIDPECAFVPGLMHPSLGGYYPRDIQFVAAFDVDQNKVGKDLASAIVAQPNNTLSISDVPPTGVIVQRGPTFDGLGRYHENIQESFVAPVDVAATLRECRVDVFLNYLPVGSQRASEWYLQQALEAGCAVVNCIPVFIASRKEWAEKFEALRLPLIGDDVKSQLGATIAHRVLARLFNQRGIRLDRTYQLNFGGNMDFKNMLAIERLESKRVSKTDSVVSQLDHPMDSSFVHISPSDHVPWLGDQKVAYIRFEGTGFGGAPMEIELRMQVWDSPNSGGVVIDAIRCCKIARDRGIGGVLLSASAYLMKSPPQQLPDEEAFLMLEDFISGRCGHAR